MIFWVSFRDFALWINKETNRNHFQTRTEINFAQMRNQSRNCPLSPVLARAQRLQRQFSGTANIRQSYSMGALEAFFGILGLGASENILLGVWLVMAMWHDHYLSRLLMLPDSRILSWVMSRSQTFQELNAIGIMRVFNTTDYDGCHFIL